MGTGCTAACRPRAGPHTDTGRCCRIECCQRLTQACERPVCAAPWRRRARRRRGALTPGPRAQFEADKESAAAASMARVLYDTALLESGFDLEAPKAFNERVYQLLAGAFGIKGDLAVSPADAAAAAAADEVRAQAGRRRCRAHSVRAQAPDAGA